MKECERYLSWMTGLWLKWRSLWQRWARICCGTTVLSTLSYFLHPLPTGLNLLLLKTLPLSYSMNRRLDYCTVFSTKHCFIRYVMNQYKLLHCTTYPQSHWCEHFDHSWHEWWVQQCRWWRSVKILRLSSFLPGSDSSEWGSYHRPWHAGASPRWRMSNHTADTGISCVKKGFTWSLGRQSEINNSYSELLFPHLVLKEWDSGEIKTAFPPHLMNLSKILSTHICIRRKLNPYRQSMRKKFTINQSLSSKVSSFPSKIAILLGTSFRGGIPIKKTGNIKHGELYLYSL